MSAQIIDFVAYRAAKLAEAESPITVGATDDVPDIEIRSFLETGVSLLTAQALYE